MQQTYHRALVAGTERVTAWADLLDRINVFPIADGDTGRNLVLSLTPILEAPDDEAELARRLLFSARGNSGNIAARFFSGFLELSGADRLAQAARRGNELAWSAVSEPKRGTMLSLFEALCEGLEHDPPHGASQWVSRVLDRLEHAVRESSTLLPQLRSAGVVDSGALGMFIFFDGFLSVLDGRDKNFRPVTDAFKDQLEIAHSWRSEPGTDGYCIDAVVDVRELAADDARQQLAAIGHSVVSVEHGGYVKLHLHAACEEEARARIDALGRVVSWSSDDLEDQTKKFLATRGTPAIHVMTDAAGSVTSDDASVLGMTLLDSYVNIDTRSVPETRLAPRELYRAMKEGLPVSTSQASTFEKHQRYESVLSLHQRVLYLCVGSAFTGNFQTVTEWKARRDPDDRMTVLDTGAASGRLGLVALATALYAHLVDDPDDVIRFARGAIDACAEYLFLDRLHYLAAGGRLSRTSAFFGDLLHMRPVVSPTAEGAKKVAVLRNKTDQVEFAVARLEQARPDVPYVIVLEYTDNEEWVRVVPGKQLQQRHPAAKILMQPMSLTSGAHMGPGSWGVAFLPVTDGIGSLIKGGQATVLEPG